MPLYFANLKLKFTMLEKTTFFLLTTRVKFLFVCLIKNIKSDCITSHNHSLEL